MLLLVLTTIGFAIAFANAALALRNLRLYRTTPEATALSDADRERVAGVRLAVCIPARDEEANIEACVRSVLANDVPGLTVYVYDDGSTDQTPQILDRLAAEDARVRLPARRELLSGWNGKQHACARCAIHAFGLGDDPGSVDGGETNGNEGPSDARMASDVATHVLFIDADVRLTPDAIQRSLTTFVRGDEAVRGRGISGCQGLGLLSTFPRQQTGTLSEAVIVPLIFFLLFSYLPFRRMRRTLAPPASAACGQFIIVSRAAYRAFGGHASFRDTMHDGIKMPRAARRAGYLTDIFDGSDLASVRMYRGFDETWRGFTKNAYEGLGSFTLLVFLTLMNLFGHVLPPLVVVLLPVLSAATGTGVELVPWGIALAATAAPITQRVLTADRLKHAAIGALLHPVGVVLMSAIQWRSFYLHATGKRTWRGRADAAAVGAAEPSPG